MDDSSVQGFLLLTIQDCVLAAPAHPPQSGYLSVECITLLISGAAGVPQNQVERDVWLVLRHSATNFEIAIPATQNISHSRLHNTYTLTDIVPGGNVVLKLPQATTPADAEDLETFEVILAQYAVLHEIDPVAPGQDGDLKGRLVLVDEEDGHVVGTLGESFRINEAPDVHDAARAKDPVIVEFPDQGQNQVYVHPASPEEQDFLMKTAGLLSRGIVFAANTVASGMQYASDYYVAHSTPNAEPIVFSETTRRNVRRAHGISATAVKVTAKTTGMIHGMVEKLADRVSGRTPTNSRPPSPHPSAAYAPGVLAPGQTPPPLPPRHKNNPSTSSLQPPPSPLLSPSSPTSSKLTPPPLPPRPRRLLNRVLVASDMLLTTIEHSATHLIQAGTSAASRGLGHKYGPDVGNAAQLMGDTARNVGVVYIDARGVGRRALLKTAGKRIIKGRMGSRDVVFGGPEVQREYEATMAGMGNPQQMPPAYHPSTPQSPYPSSPKGPQPPPSPKAPSPSSGSSWFTRPFSK